MRNWMSWTGSSGRYTGKYKRAVRQIRTGFGQIWNRFGNEKALRNRLRFSRSGVVTGLSVSYNQVEQIIRETKNKMEMPGGQEAEKEEKILLAEYALDFAMQAAERALLLSLEAMEAQTKQQEKKEETMP